MHDRFDRISERLEWLRQNDGAGTVFGASQHGYQTGDVLTEDQIAAFESEHEVALPAEYRAYLAKIGNGGAGPFYGLAPLSPPKAEWVFLADQGCGYFDFLIVKGANAGQVWSDYSAGDGEIGKSFDSFLDWYEDWLERAHIEWIEKNAEGMALYAERNYPGIDECVRLLDQALERAPKWADGWRARGYVNLNREQFDSARAAFETAAEHGQQEADARRHLDLARLAALQGDWGETRKQAALGIASDGVWWATKQKLRRAQLAACDRLEDADAAIETLEAMAADETNDRNHHFLLAFRRLLREQPDRAWRALGDVIERNVGPDRHNAPATREGVYEDFANWLAQGDNPELAELVRGKI